MGNELMTVWVKKHWFLLALLTIAFITLVDQQQWTVNGGRWLKNHGGPDMVIFFIFLFSGIALDARLLRKGLQDVNATLSALAVIFILSPLTALVFYYFPLDVQVLTGLFLVAVMPSTLSSGVVMTHAAGGNMAHALFVTIVANTLAVFTIPVVLSLLLTIVGQAQSIPIDKAAIMLKIARMVLLPLGIGMVTQQVARPLIAPLQRKASSINQLLVLTIVWMGLCQSRQAILSGGHAIFPIVATVFTFHLLLVLLATAVTRLTGLKSGRRESVIFMGGQKTLPLSVILQVSLFPHYGLALVVCVLHHIIHLIMDAYLVTRLRNTIE
jgi:solute carrier family 10 (sodium/bile acid cotransporter), member 7